MGNSPPNGSHNSGLGWPRMEDCRRTPCHEPFEIAGTRTGHVADHGGDLNRDWEITRAELKAVLRLTGVQGAAEAFVSSDDDNNGILTAQEIRKAIELQASMRGGGCNRSANILAVFDFNEANVLAPEEYDRGVAALGG